LRDAESAKGEDNDEREANLFAAELLMPAKFLTEDVKSIDLDLLSDSTVLDSLATKYKVSGQALTFRLANLGYINVESHLLLRQRESNHFAFVQDKMS